MSIQTFGKFSLDPAVNPAVIDTGTWNSDVVKTFCQKLPRRLRETLSFVVEPVRFS